jgi:hypothetical protein
MKRVAHEELQKSWPVSLAFFNMAYWVYILQSQTTGRYYCGQTDDIEKRLLQHNDPENTFTRTTSRFKGRWLTIKPGGSRETLCAVFPIIYRMFTRYLDTDDDSSIRKRESSARLKPWGLHPLSAIISSEFSHSPFFEQSCLTTWLRLGSQNTRLIKYGKAEHGANWPWVDFLPIERPTRVRPFLNEIGTARTRALPLPEHPLE